MIAELIGFVGFLLLVVAPVILVREWLTGGSRASLIRWLVVPFGFGIVSEVLFQLSWWLALRKGFHYDDEQGEASWIEAGERRTFKFSGQTPTAGAGTREFMRR